MKFRNLEGRLHEVDTVSRKIKWKGKSPSKYQKSIKDFLYNYWKNDAVLEELAIRTSYKSSVLRFDFFNLSKWCIVEADSDLHIRENSHFHQKEDAFLDAVNRDIIKDEWAKVNNIKVVRIYQSDFPLTKEKLEKIHGKFL